MKKLKHEKMEEVSGRNITTDDVGFI